MPDMSMREVTAEQFRMPDRPGKNDITSDVMMGEREKQRIQRIVALHKRGFSPEKIAQLCFCHSADSLSRVLEVPRYELDRIAFNDGSGMEKSPAERQDNIYQSRLAYVCEIIERHGNNDEESIDTTHSSPTNPISKRNARSIYRMK